MTIEINENVPVEHASPVEATRGLVMGKVAQLGGNVIKQAQMAWFDAREGTNYRSIYNTLQAEKRKKQFEHRIGLIALH
jgi:hypothetical protein